MNEILTVHYNDVPIYNIILNKSYNLLPLELEKMNIKDHKICIITDSNVSSLYLNKVEHVLEKSVSYIDHFIFEAGEKSKNLDTVKKLYKHLIMAKFDRDDVLIALGGGVVGDLTGYTAATYLRGIRFIQLPTTLLAMVDSSIGGKTGVDFDSYKNIVGAFHQPSCVYINLLTLNSLNDKQFACGMGEIIKHGLIKDSSYYEWLKYNNIGILNKDINLLQEMIYKSCIIKKEVVENDPTEKGERAILNFGHTLGHAIEKLKNFTMLHGECVSIGCIMSAYISFKRGTITENTFNDILNTFKLYSLFNESFNINDLDSNEILQVSKYDKKMESGKIKFILLKNIGETIIDKTVTDKEIIDAINYITSIYI